MNVQIITIIIILLFAISLATQLLIDVMIIVLNGFIVYVSNIFNGKTPLNYGNVIQRTRSEVVSPP